MSGKLSQEKLIVEFHRYLSLRNFLPFIYLFFGVTLYFHNFYMLFPVFTFVLFCFPLVS